MFLSSIFFSFRASLSKCLYQSFFITKTLILWRPRGQRLAIISFSFYAVFNSLSRVARLHIIAGTTEYFHNIHNNGNSE